MKNHKENKENQQEDIVILEDEPLQKTSQKTTPITVKFPNNAVPLPAETLKNLRGITSKIPNKLVSSLSPFSHFPTQSQIFAQNISNFRGIPRNSQNNDSPILELPKSPVSKVDFVPFPEFSQNLKDGSSRMTSASELFISQDNSQNLNDSELRLEILKQNQELLKQQRKLCPKSKQRELEIKHKNEIQTLQNQVASLPETKDNSQNSNNSQLRLEILKLKQELLQNQRKMSQKRKIQEQQEIKHQNEIQALQNQVSTLSESKAIAIGKSNN